MHYIKRHEANTLCDEDEKRHEAQKGKERVTRWSQRKGDW